MSIFYNLIGLLVLLIYLPRYAIKRKFHKGFTARFGVLPRGLNLDKPIWIHAVSVGEVMVIRGLLEELRKAYPNKKFVISTVTVTGNKIAKEIAKEGDFVTFLPLDFSFIVRKVIRKIKPCLFIIAETEIWPNLISFLKKENVPVISINARISDSSFKGYSRIKPLISPVLRKIDFFCVQTDIDAERLNSLGVSTDKISVTGNMKFDRRLASDISAQDCRKKLGLQAADRIFVAASTHEGEEEAALTAYKELLNKFQDLKLLIAPRHPERSAQVADIVASFGFRPLFTSNLPYECPTCITEPVFILNTVGELMSYYSAADVVFVGGSLMKVGGHNILEPASLAKPVITGEHMFNFRDITDLFVKNSACIVVHDQVGLRIAVRKLLEDRKYAQELAARALSVVKSNQGATNRSLEVVKRYLSGRIP